jgi:hypothetical protein
MLTDNMLSEMMLSADNMMSSSDNMLYYYYQKTIKLDHIFFLENFTHSET